MSVIVSLLSYVVMRLMPTGRRIWVLKQMRAVAVEMKLQELIRRIDAALVHDEKTLNLDRLWRASKSNKSRSRGNALPIDREIDARFSAIQSILRGFSVGQETRDYVKAARRITSELFPSGIGEIINLPFEEQSIELDSMLEQLDGPLAADVEAVHIDGLVQELRELNEAFTAELAKFPVRDVSFDVVLAARTEGHENLAGIVAWVVGTFSGRDPENTATREGLLAEFNRQQTAVYESQRRRQIVTDVHPDTGEELEPSDDAEETAA